MTPTLRHSLQILSLAAGVATAACGSSATVSPTSPSSVTLPSATPASSGAVITGRVTGVSTTAQFARTADGVSSFGGAQTAATSDSAITVTVVGTGTSTTVGPTGDFTLTGVPSGSVQLQFSGRGANAMVTISGVQPTDRIEISVQISGSSAQVQSENRQNRDTNGVDVNGRVISIDPLAGTFVVGTTTVTVPPGTRIRHGSRVLTLADIKVGDKVEVKGTRTATGVTASEVKVESAGNKDDDDDDDEDDDEDSMSSNSGKGSANSGKGSKDSKDDDDDEEDDDDDEDDDEDDAGELKGKVASLGSGSCPAISFVIGGVTVTTSASTKFDDISCTSIKVGSSLEVKGTKTGTTMVATKVEKD